MGMVTISSETARARIETANRSFEEAMRAGDAARIADNYTDDGVCSRNGKNRTLSLFGDERMIKALR